jgi:anti-sigma B factor antagonist
MTTPLKIDSRTEGDDIAILSLTGEVDVANAAQVRDAALQLIERGATRLIVDLSQTEYMDSTALGTLVGLLKRLKESDGQLVIAAPQPRVRRLFTITGLDRIFPLRGDLEAALQEVRP